ncbi:methyltransferase domain-containing protein [uncultured Methylobacterium sp.]|uniref:class I SAM-dependent DNA methyltransferase n=1 Tax=uncultured Methylobacterium sp. TaxID=157278 RepID=UPI0035CA2D9D
MRRQTGSGDLLADRRYAYAEACLAEGDAAGAAEMADQVLELAPRYAAAWVLLGRAREAQAAVDPALFHGAVRAYETARTLDPDDALGTQVHLARLGAGGALPALSPAYVRALFDGYAGRFERHLVEGLGYRGPTLLCAALDAAAGTHRRYPVAIDLGCGTGLMGAALGSRVAHLIGVDLAPAMLALARRKDAYARLIEGEIVGFLAEKPESHADLCVAADVFIYLADLGPVLAGIGRVLRPEGHAAFTVQSHDGGGVILGTDGRYAHADAHLRDATARAGLAEVALHPAAVRREQGRDVPGRLVVLRKPRLGQPLEETQS